MSEELFDAIRAAWSAESAAGDLWSVDNPARGQCDATSLVVFDYLGGDLQLAKVLIDGEQTEYHYWNLLADGALDLTLEQFGPEHVVEPMQIITAAFLRGNYDAMKPELRVRHALLRDAVAERLGAAPADPLAASV